jgi:hypothetical protein
MSSATMVSKTKRCGRSDKQNLEFGIFFYRGPAVSSARMASKTKSCGRSDEQNLDFDVFFTGGPRCHLREWYQKVRHVDEATSKVLTSIYSLQETCGVICENAIKNYDTWTKRQAKS